jgi:hypothetical protein
MHADWSIDKTETTSVLIGSVSWSAASPTTSAISKNSGVPSELQRVKLQTTKS